MKRRIKSLLASFVVAGVFSVQLVSVAHANEYPGLENLTAGVQNEYVREVQEALVRLGYSISPTNGRYGPQTIQAVSEFYSSRGDRSDGTSIGPAGYKAIMGQSLAGLDPEPEQAPAPETKKKKKVSKKAATRQRFREMGDVTLINGTRKSRAAREAVTFEQWQAAPFTKYIAKKESNRRCKAVNRSGKYRGRWQMDKNFWSSYGGKKFAKRPEKASCQEQDLVAYRGWIARGWQPWNY